MAERETEDRRVRKTKKQLRGALTSLLLEKDISRVTVRDVADLADVNRGTFYAHYSAVWTMSAAATTPASRTGRRSGI